VGLSPLNTCSSCPWVQQAIRVGFYGAVAGAVLAGVLVGTIEGIRFLGQRYGKLAATIGGVTLASIFVVCIVIARIGFAGGFEPVHEVTFTVTGEGEVIVKYYNGLHHADSVTLPWKRMITTEQYKAIQVYPEEGAMDVSCSIEEDGRHMTTYQARPGYPLHCDYYPTGSFFSKLLKLKL
jgi:hypothetical protein